MRSFHFDSPALISFKHVFILRKTRVKARIILFSKIIKIRTPMKMLKNRFDLEDWKSPFLLAVRFFFGRLVELWAKLGFLELLSFNSDVRGWIKWREKIAQRWRKRETLIFKIMVNLVIKKNFWYYEILICKILIVKASFEWIKSGQLDCSTTYEIFTLWNTDNSCFFIRHCIIHLARITLL